MFEYSPASLWEEDFSEVEIYLDVLLKYNADINEIIGDALLQYAVK